MVDIPEDSPFFEDSNESIFVRSERTETYQDDFAIRLTEDEQNALRVQVICEVIYNPKPRSTNFAYNPERSVYGRVVCGTNDFVVIRDMLIQYPQQLIYEYRNEPMLTRMYQTFVDRLGIKSLQFHASASVAAMVSAGADLNQYSAMITDFNNQELNRLLAANLVEQAATGALARFVPLGFRPNETHWKFTSDIPGTWFQVTVRRWDWVLTEDFPIAPPDPEREDDASSPDSQSPESPATPTPGAPPAPGEESQQDPRANPDDYSTAPEYEPPPPPDPSGVFRLSFVVTFSDRPPLTGDFGCTFLSPPLPTVEKVTDSSGRDNYFAVGKRLNGTELRQQISRDDKDGVFVSLDYDVEECQ